MCIIKYSEKDWHSRPSLALIGLNNIEYEGRIILPSGFILPFNIFERNSLNFPTEYATFTDFR